MDILEELYQGGIIPAERRCKPTARYSKLQGCIARNQETLTQGLSAQQLEAFEKYRDNLREEELLGEQDAFACGFRLGTQLMLAAVQPWNSEGI